DAPKVASRASDLQFPQAWISHSTNECVQTETERTRTEAWDATMAGRIEKWAKKEGIQPSGPGSTVEATAKVRPFLREVFDKLKIRTFLDVPCGDMTWMPGVEYMGGDISPSLVASNLRSFASDAKFANRFAVFDITCMIPPKVDMIHTRDVFIHLDSNLSMQALRNFERSGSKYVAIPNWPSLDGSSNEYHPKGQAYDNVHRYNLELPPYCLPSPMYSSQNLGTDGLNLLGVWELPALGRGTRPGCR
ncbi:unnamed protein product, partial [Symbiodinium necroappetens]